MRDTLTKNNLMAVRKDSTTEESIAAYDTNPMIGSPLSEKHDSLEYTDTISVQIAHYRNSPSYVGFGGGVCFPGSLWGLGYTYITTKDRGVSIRFNSNIFKSRNVPGDYYSDGNRVFAPKDYINTVSLDFVQEFVAANKARRYGIEAGPSWVISRKAEFELNPDYDPSEERSWWFSTYKYHKSHGRENAFGVSLRFKMEFLIDHATGFELAAYTNINEIHSVFGIELDAMLGRTGYSKAGNRGNGEH